MGGGWELGLIYGETAPALMTRIKPTFHRAAIALAICSAAVTAWAQNGPQAKLPVAELTAGMHVIHAELAVTPEQQATGMMFRQGMGANDGMLFVNDDAGVRCFWMRNTLIPLSIAFVADDGTVVNIADMAPRSDASHCSAQPVRYALEVPAGWFAKRGFKAGLKLRGGPFGN
jgi:uncharacterized membrane protein (UPF0127 family)